MKRASILLLTVIFILSFFSGCKEEKISVLIVTGQNKQHNWEVSHKILKEILVNSKLFNVTITVSPQAGEDMSIFNPNFFNHDLVVLDYNGDEWSENTKASFEKYVSGGGGLVVYQAATNAFPKWDAYIEMIGLGGRKGRNKKSDSYTCYNQNDELIRKQSKGIVGSQNYQHEFTVAVRAPKHPIVKGTPKHWLHAKDKLIAQLTEPAKNTTILATAYSDPEKKGSGKHEPVIMATKYGKGRVFHTTLGHVDTPPCYALQSAGFILTFLRGAEWAATGSVKQPIPADLPNIAAPFILPRYRFYTLDEIFNGVKKFEYGKSQKFVNLIRNRIKQAKGQKDQLKEIERRMLYTLQSDATIDCKNYLCRELSWMGSKKSLPVLKDMTHTPETKEMAYFALSRLQQVHNP